LFALARSALDASVHDILPHFMLLIDKVRKRAEEFDVLHFHIDPFHFPLFRSLEARTLTTLHGRQDLEDLKPFYYRFGEMPLVSVSSDQRKAWESRPAAGSEKRPDAGRAGGSRVAWEHDRSLPLL
jgi:hypothetical protein